MRSTMTTEGEERERQKAAWLRAANEFDGFMAERDRLARLAGVTIVPTRGPWWRRLWRFFQVTT